MSKKGATDKARPTPGREFNFRCGKCGERAKMYLLHYQKFECPGCRLVVWALEPKRDSPLKLFIHPGPHISSDYANL